MTEEKIVCYECGTENEPQYPYCKNCGATLIEEKKTDNSQEHKEENTNNNSADNGGFSCEPQSDYACIDGIPLEEIQVFIGKKSNDIMPKFINMEITHSKNSWLWPPAILGFLMGPMGAAIWFFYRKMYKYAFILAGIGAVVSLITAFLTFDSTNVYMDSLFKAFSTGNMNEMLSVLEGAANDGNTILNVIATTINNVIDIATSVIVGIFACNLYKNHCIGKIKEFRSMNPNNNYYRLGLMSLGGTSGGMVALGLLLLFGVDCIIEFLTVVLTLIK